MSRIITLTTDFGLQDYYVGVAKGMLLAHCPDINIVDISHTVKNFDIVQASFILKNTWHVFSDNTIHIVSVNNLGGDNHRYLVFEHEKHFFIGPDNGIFSLMFEKIPPRVFALSLSGLQFRPIIEVILTIVQNIINGSEYETWSLPAGEIIQRFVLKPVINRNQIRGSVIYIDNFDNIILNITKELFEEVGKGRAFQLFFKRHDPILRISAHYNEVPIGDTLCLFNHNNHLEIAIHMGKAAEMHGLKIEDMVQIDFFS